MKQVIVIHGGTTFSTYEKYIEYLETRSVIPERLEYKTFWKENLTSVLGDGYQVLLPSMPNKVNAKYREWKIWFDRIGEILKDDCILIGHSLGAVFLAKYLSENKLPVKVSGTLLVAAPFSDESLEDLADFKLESISPLFSEQAGAVSFFNGTDDPVISLADPERYRQQLPNAEYVLLPAPDHFMRSDFPELTEKIRSL